MIRNTRITAVFFVAVLGIVVPPVNAGIWVAPAGFDVELIEGCTLTETLTIGNDGIEDLNFTVRTRQVGVSAPSGGKTCGVSAAGQTGLFSISKDHDFMVLGDTPYKPGELIVRFTPKAAGIQRSAADKNRILSSLGGAALKRNFKIVPGLSVVKLPGWMTVKEALKIFNKADGILYAEPNYEVRAIWTFPDDTRFDELWGMHNTGQTGGTADADIDAPAAWDITIGSNEIIVAVIDTGVDYNHPDLAANMWVNEGEVPGNGVDDDDNGYVDDIYGYDFCTYGGHTRDSDPMDDCYHGTHCAGTIGAIGNNSEGVAGVCWNVRIMALKFIDSTGYGYTSDAAECVEYATLMGANLSSNSWGGYEYSQALKDAIDAAAAAGMLFVAGAGNNGINNDMTPFCPASYDSNNIISVMATDKNDSKSFFSNFGLTSVDLGAPGSDILSCKIGGGYEMRSGTSMATPHVAGACVLLWSMNPALSSTEVKDIILKTVDETLPGLCVSGGRLNLGSAIFGPKAAWIKVEPKHGTVAPGDSNEISITFDAVGIAPGIYEGDIIVTLNDPCSPTVIPVTMTVAPDDLVVTPAEGFESSGTKAGPFMPESMTYTLTNNGLTDVNWTTYPVEYWLDVDPCEAILEPNESMDVDVRITPDANVLDANTYTETLIFENLGTTSIKLRPVTLTVKPPDYFTQFISASDNDLKFLSLTFAPDGSIAYYEACKDIVDEFPVAPDDATPVSLGNNDFVEVILSDSKQVLFYGQSYERFYIGSNGYITFGAGDTGNLGALGRHFSMPRISALFDNLEPPLGGTISYKQLDDSIVVTFKDVPLYDDEMAKNSFQVELFFANGIIRITWLDVAADSGVAGLSQGQGLPIDFVETDLSKYLLCRPFCDLDRDYDVDWLDLSIFAFHWLDTDCNVPYWCGRADLDFDGVVNLDDYSTLARNWLCPSCGL